MALDLYQSFYISFMIILTLSYKEYTFLNKTFDTIFSFIF